MTNVLPRRRLVVEYCDGMESLLSLLGRSIPRSFWHSEEIWEWCRGNPQAVRYRATCEFAWYLGKLQRSAVFYLYATLA